VHTPHNRIIAPAACAAGFFFIDTGKARHISRKALSGLKRSKKKRSVHFPRARLLLYVKGATVLRTHQQ
jgi:hypothetical protein